MSDFDKIWSGILFGIAGLFALRILRAIFALFVMATIILLPFVVVIDSCKNLHETWQMQKELWRIEEAKAQAEAQHNAQQKLESN